MEEVFQGIAISKDIPMQMREVSRGEVPKDFGMQRPSALSADGCPGRSVVSLIRWKAQVFALEGPVPIGTTVEAYPTPGDSSSE